MLHALVASPKMYRRVMHSTSHKHLDMFSHDKARRLYSLPILKDGPQHRMSLHPLMLVVIRAPASHWLAVMGVDAGLNIHQG